VDLLEQFRQAGREGQAYRPAPFWSWNDDMDPDELRRQIREMKEAGLGGHMIRARAGLVTPYLGERWMECIRAAVDESARLGMAAWLYAEDGGPGGGEGGGIPAKEERFRRKWIVAQEVAPEFYEPSERLLAAFIGAKEGGEWTSLRRVEDPEKARAEAAKLDGGMVLQFSYGVGERSDLLSRETAGEFLREGCEIYAPVVGDRFGKAVPGVFADAPPWMHVPWSFDLPAFYRDLYAEDPLDALPSLFFPVGDYLKLRYRFWSAATRLSVRSFSQQAHGWRDRHGLILTVHQRRAGDGLDAQIRSIGAAMPHYSLAGMPGIDPQGRRNADPLSVKQAASVGSQLGKRVLSEMYGGAGWSLSLEELKWIAERQFALGVNFSRPHLALYSLRGRRKRDQPPSLHVQQPWWPDYKMLNDRFARLLFMLTQGKRVTDLLLLHPIGSAWAIHDPNDSSAVNEMSRHFSGISKFLLGIHRDHDYGDESLMESHGVVSGDKLKVGDAEYGVVILPPLVTLQSSVAKLLREFHAAGGKLILIGDGPERLDGEAGPEADRFREWLEAVATRCPRDDADALERALFAFGWPRLQIKDEEGEYAESILVHHRDLGSRQIFFFANSDPEAEVYADVALMGTGSVQEWDLDTGRVSLVPVRQAMGSAAFKLRFQPMQSRLIVLDSEEDAWIGAPGRTSDVGIFYGESEWDLTLLEPNALTLDTARYRIDDGEWSEPVNVLRIQEDLSRRAGEGEIALEFTFENRMTRDPGPLYLVTELPEEQEISVNGEPVASADEGGWTDVSFRKIPIAGRLQPGSNVITLKRKWSGGPQAAHASEGGGPDECEIEAIYLLGNFGVEAAGGPEPEPRGSSRIYGPFALVDLPATVETGDLTRQGLPFFRGTVALEQEIWLPEQPGDGDVRVILEFETLNAAVSKVSVNGREAGKLAWRPYRLDVTDLVPEGENLILRLELTGTCRNLLGPHHHIDGEIETVKPDSFTGESWEDDSDEPRSTWKDGYNVVRFGVEGDVLVIFEIVSERAPDESLRRQCR
jgi:hypothetical protein